VRTRQINYDLSAPGRNYADVIDYIKSYGEWCHLLESCWLVRTWKTAGDVRDEMNKIVDSNDKVAVFDVTKVNWATNFSADTTDWLQRQWRAA
jgi:hypothetical protein